VIAQLTKNERQLALIILLVMSVCGLAMAIAGTGDPLGVHGAIVMLAGIAGTFGVISGYYAPEPGDDRLDHYYDDPSRMGLILANGLGRRRTLCRRLDRVAARLSGPDV
jgi:cytochrome c oxidase cbb3-type subunit 1